MNYKQLSFILSHLAETEVESLTINDLFHVVSGLTYLPLPEGVNVEDIVDHKKIKATLIKWRDKGMFQQSTKS